MGVCGPCRVAGGQGNGGVGLVGGVCGLAGIGVGSVVSVGIGVWGPAWGRVCGLSRNWSVGSMVLAAVQSPLWESCSIILVWVWVVIWGSLWGPSGGLWSLLESAWGSMILAKMGSVVPVVVLVPWGVWLEDVLSHGGGPGWGLNGVPPYWLECGVLGRQSQLGSVVLGGVLAGVCGLAGCLLGPAVQGVILVEVEVLEGGPSR